VFTGVADLKKIFAEAARDHAKPGQRTLLFVDEIHRFNRSPAGRLPPLVEDGTVTLVGATTENPSFELNAALLSRAQVLILHRLDNGGAGKAAGTRRSADRPRAAPHPAKRARH
jgi:putative ATPase